MSGRSLNFVPGYYDNQYSVKVMDILKGIQMAELGPFAEYCTFPLGHRTQLVLKLGFKEMCFIFFSIFYFKSGDH